MSRGYWELLRELSEDIPTIKTKDNEITITMSQYGAAMLARQALSVSMLETLVDNGGIADGETGENLSNDLAGVSNLLDEIRDQLTDRHGYPERVVFPFMEDDKGNTPYEVPEYDLPNYKRALQHLLPAVVEALPKFLNLDPDLDAVLKRYFDKGEL